MVVISPKGMALHRLGIIALPVVLIAIALDHPEAGCLQMLFVEERLCLDNRPAFYFFYLFLLAAVSLASLLSLARSFRTIQPELLEHESDQLRHWSRDVMKQSGGTLLFPPRSLLAAGLIVALWVTPLLRLAYIHQALLPDEHPLDFLGALILGTLLVWFPVRWFSESLLLTPEGIQYRHLLRWGGIRPWSAFHHIELIDEGQRGAQAVRLHAPWFRSNILINRNTIRDDQRFCLAGRYIINRAFAAGVSIHLPVDGMQNWMDACRR